MFSLQKQQDGQQLNIIISNNCAPTMCQMSGVRCQVSVVRCQVSGVRYIYIFFNFFFFDKTVEYVRGGSVINGAYPV